MLNRNISHDIWSWNRLSPLPVTIRTPRSFLLSYHIKYDISRQTIKESKIKSNVREVWQISHFALIFVMSGAKGLEPGTSLLTGGFLTLIPAQTCVSSHFSKRNGQITNIFRIRSFWKKVLICTFFSNPSCAWPHGRWHPQCLILPFTFCWPSLGQDLRSLLRGFSEKK